MTPEQLARSGSEFSEQTALFCWANLPATRAKFPHFYNAETKRCKMYSTNQNFTDAVKGARAKQIGIQSGVADIFVPLALHGMNGLYIELKIDPEHPVNDGSKGKKKRGRLSEEQLAFRDQVQADGFGWACCEGWKAASSVIAQYLGDQVSDPKS